MRRSIAGGLSSLAMLGGLGPVASAAPESSATLGLATVRVELPLGQPPADNAVLQVVVSKVRNPAKTPVSVLVTLQDTEQRSPRVEVFRFALFPSDAPGRFISRADRAVELIAGRLGARPTRLMVGIEFDPAAGPMPAGAAAELEVSASWTEPTPLR